MAERTACVWCPDWPVVVVRGAGRVGGGGPVVVLGGGGRVRAASVEARVGGVRRGMRRRDAEAACPDAVVVETDEPLEARAFEAVARALGAVTHRLAVERPGLLWFPTRGPARYFGGDAEIARRVLVAVAGTGVEARVGIASSPFAALLAARHTSPGSPSRVLSDDETRSFLSVRPVGVLSERGLGDVAGVLVRLGVRTVGDLSALPQPAVAARFGDRGVAAHRLASGLDDGPSPLAAPVPELAERAEFDPPAQRIDEAVFAGKGLADRLLDRLEARGLVCIRVSVEVETEHGDRLARTWRLTGPVTAGVVTQRVRWQLEAWLTEEGPLGGGLTWLGLIADEVMPAVGRQLDFWGGDERATERAARALARLQGMLGPEAVVTPVLRGGRTPAERSGWVPWGDAPGLDASTAAVPTATTSRVAGVPWPGVLPPPEPARVYAPPLPAELLDGHGEPVRVSGRGELSAPPARLESPVARGEVRAWGGPWPQDVRWWDSAQRRRHALFQIEIDEGAGAEAVACVVAVSGGAAFVEALYD